MEKQIIARIAVMMVVTLVIASILVVFITIQEQEETPTVVKYDIYVDDDGTADYTSIQDAIDDASDGDSIFVYNGIYYERIVIDKSISLFGENKNITIINGSGNGTVVKITNGNVEISGFTITNGGNDINGRRAIEIFDSDYNTISNNIVSFTFRGLFLYSSNYNSIYGNIFKDNNGTGIFISLSNFSDVFNNKVVNNHGGIFVGSSNSNKISDNLIQSNRQIGLRITSSKNNVISNNIVSSNAWRGIDIEYSSDNIIEYNNISNNSDWGISIQFSCYNNSIYHNNFLKNTPRNVADECSNLYYNTTLNEGNYWDDYNGKDDNDDGIGDTPYYILYGGNKDSYPLMNPVDI